MAAGRAVAKKRAGDRLHPGGLQCSTDEGGRPAVVGLATIAVLAGARTPRASRSPTCPGAVGNAVANFDALVAPWEERTGNDVVLVPDAGLDHRPVRAVPPVARRGTPISTSIRRT
jgi:hypothetical protein